MFMDFYFNLGVYIVVVGITLSFGVKTVLAIVKK